jgi:phosphate-selective porin OprO/OprP
MKFAWWRTGQHLAGVAALLIAVHSIGAQQTNYQPSTAPAAPEPVKAASADEDLKARIERLEHQNQELLKKLDNIQNTSHATEADAIHPAADQAKSDGTEQVKKIVAEYLNQHEAAKKQEEEEKKAKQAEEGYRVGSDLTIKASFQDGLFLWLNTPNNDFSMHIGGWMQEDNVWFGQSPGMRALPGARSGPKQGVASGTPTGGIGDLEDGTYFRRIRIFVEGNFWEQGEYRLITALENDQFSTIGLDEFWVGAKDIPLIGTARVGHIKDTLGLEADMTASSRAMTFMERSSYSEAIELNQNFVTGVWLGNNYLDERMTWSGAAFRTDQGSSSGVFFGDGQYGLGLRLTALPIFECEGRHLLHIGWAGGYRNGTNNLASSPDRLFQLRARPELRDDDPGGSPSGAQIIPNANSNRMIDTGPIVARDEFITGLEALYIRGPFSVQAEYGWNWISDAIGISPTGLVLSPALTSPQNYVFNGGYVQLAYTLTGENRAYDKRIGTLAREYFKGGPFTNAWFLRDENGHLTWGLGAWEIAGRFSYVNLNDGTGLNRIQGGTMEGFTAALNWYLNSNAKVMFDWVYDHRDDVPSATTAGYAQGFGIEVQLSY